jgi:hypothetical protein
MKAWQDGRDQERLFDFDEPRFFHEINLDWSIRCPDPSFAW